MSVFDGPRKRLVAAFMAKDWDAYGDAAAELRGLLHGTNAESCESRLRQGSEPAYRRPHMPLAEVQAASETRFLGLRIPLVQTPPSATPLDLADVPARPRDKQEPERGVSRSSEGRTGVDTERRLLAHIKRMQKDIMKKRIAKREQEA